MVFGLAVGLQCSVAVLVGIPSPLLPMAPYVITDLGVSGPAGEAPPPAADGNPCFQR